MTLSQPLLYSRSQFVCLQNEGVAQGYNPRGSFNLNALKAGRGWTINHATPATAPISVPSRDPKPRMRPLPSTRRSLDPCDCSTSAQGPPKAYSVAWVVLASSMLVSWPQPGRTLTDSQQGHVDEEVPYGRDHILAHLPFHFLGVQLRREAFDTEHRGSASPASSCRALLFSAGASRPELGSTRFPVLAPHFRARRRKLRRTILVLTVRL